MGSEAVVIIPVFSDYHSKPRAELFFEQKDDIGINQTDARHQKSCHQGRVNGGFLKSLRPLYQISIRVHLSCGLCVQTRRNQIFLIAYKKAVNCVGEKSDPA
jgi:hypothetical protein